MTVTATEKPRSRFELARRQLAEREEEWAETRQRVERLQLAEDGQVADEVRRAPTRRPYGLGGLPLKTRTQREKLERKLPILEREIAALRKLVDEEAASHYSQELRERAAEGAALREAQIEVWRRMGATFAGLHTDFLAVVDLATELDQLAGRVEASEAWRTVSEEERLAFRAAARVPIQPHPRSFADCVSKLLDAAVDPRGVGCRHPAGIRSDHEMLLPQLVPDLRPADRQAALSGRVDQMRA